MDGLKNAISNKVKEEFSRPNYTPEEIVYQAQRYGVSPEHFKAQLDKGWKPLIVFKE